MNNGKESLDEWFMDSVLPHEQALMRFLYRNWQDNSSEVNDLSQEVLARVYAAAQKERPIRIKSFIFATARNLLCDMIRREQVVRIEAVMDIEALNVINEEVGIEEQISSRQELKHLQVALESLPGNCRKVVELRRVWGYSQKETANQLGITEAAVEAHIQRGVLRLSEALRFVSEIAACKFNSKINRKADAGEEI